MTPKEAKTMLPEHWNATSHMRDCYDKSYWKAS